jgi:putative component of membrane protein insertase Oxa1/YidC/SpoIIIJ protein YidD
VEAIKKYGALKGSILSFKRVIKCRPGFGKYKNCGYDPVP